ncbi:USP20_33 [Mytilus coruscus]|uniref:USP20_33 n=1 Tax=Mytilus coruscus TaxID=42192 RepID=A0A6J8C9K8_MYTCO|nr:USP20_33 [Mytilus coruscus]
MVQKSSVEKEDSGKEQDKDRCSYTNNIKLDKNMRKLNKKTEVRIDAERNELEIEDREVEFVKTRITGIMNIGNSCWFNALLVTMGTVDAVKIGLDHYNEDLTFCPGLSEVLKNDAEEFLSTAIADLFAAVGSDHMIKIREVVTCVDCGNVGVQEQQYPSLQLCIPKVAIASLQINKIYSYESVTLKLVACYSPEKCTAVLLSTEDFIYVDNSRCVKHISATKFERFVSGSDIIAFCDTKKIQTTSGINKANGKSFAEMFHWKGNIQFFDTTIKKQDIDIVEMFPDCIE